MRYRKRPLEIEAMRLLHTSAECSAVYRWVQEHIGSTSNKDIGRRTIIDGKDAAGIESGVTINPATGQMVIRTLEGDMTVPLGWWVIRGVAGEFYSCRNDIFEATYEAVDG